MSKEEERISWWKRIVDFPIHIYKKRDMPKFELKDSSDLPESPIDMEITPHGIVKKKKPIT